MKASFLLAALVLHVCVAEKASAADSLTLEQAITLARKHHPAIEAQRARVIAMQGQKTQALASLLPFFRGQVSYAPQTANFVATPAVLRGIINNAGGSATVLDTNGQPVDVSCRMPGQGTCRASTPAPFSFRLTNFYTLNTGVTWNVWDWGHSIYGYKSASSNVASARMGTLTAQRDVVLGVKLAFFAVVAGQDQLSVSEEAVITYQKQLEQIEAFHRTGLRTGIDVATAQSALAQAELTLAQSKATLVDAQTQLALALGEDAPRTWQLVRESAHFDAQDSDREMAETTTQSLIERALRQRSEPREIELSAQSFAERRHAARGQYLPQLQVDLGPSFAGVNNLVPNFTITLSLTYPENGMSPFLVSGAMREAEGNHLAALAQARLVRERVQQEAVNARAQLQAAREEVTAAMRFVTAASGQRELAQGRYQTGLGNIIEWVDAQLNYQNARYRQVVSGYNLASARAQLSHALGMDN